MSRTDNRFLCLILLSVSVAFGQHRGLQSNQPSLGQLPLVMINDNRDSLGDYGYSGCMRDDILTRTYIQYNRYVVVTRTVMNNYLGGYTATYTPTCGGFTREAFSGPVMEEGYFLILLSDEHSGRTGTDGQKELSVKGGILNTTSSDDDEIFFRVGSLSDGGLVDKFRAGGFTVASRFNVLSQNETENTANYKGNFTKKEYANAWRRYLDNNNFAGEFGYELFLYVSEGNNLRPAMLLKVGTPSARGVTSYAVYGVWKGNTALAEKYGLRGVNDGERVYMSQLAMTPGWGDNEFESYFTFGDGNGSIKRMLRYGAMVYTERDARNNMDKLVWRSKQYCSECPIGPTRSDTIDFINDNLKAANSRLGSIFSYYSQRGRSIHRMSEQDYQTVLEYARVLSNSIAIPNPSDLNNAMMVGYPDMFWYFGLFRNGFLKDMNEEDDFMSRTADESTDYDSYMSGRILGDFIDPTVYKGGYGQDALGIIYGANGEEPKPHWRSAVSNNMINSNLRPKPSRIYAKNNPLRQLNGAELMFDPTKGISFNLKGTHKCNAARKTDNVIDSMYVYIYQLPDGRQVRWCNLCGKSSASPTLSKHEYTGDRDGGVLHPDKFSSMGFKGHGGHIQSIQGTAFVYDEMESLEPERVLSISLDNSVYSCTSRDGNPSLCALPNDAALVGVDVLRAYEREENNTVWGWVPGVFWGTHSTECPYDPQRIGGNVDDYHGNGERTGTGDVTRRVSKIFGQMQNIFNKSREEGGLDGGKFVADTAFTDYGFSKSGFSNIERLREKSGLYFEVNGNLKEMGREHYLDSAWFIANPQNQNSPYEDYIEWIVYNDYYQGSDEFLRLYTQPIDGSWNITTICPPWPLGEMLDWHYTWLHDQSFGLTFRWPIIYRDKENWEHDIGYLVYIPPIETDFVMHLGNVNHNSGRHDDRPDNKQFWVHDSYKIGNSFNAASAACGLFSSVGKQEWYHARETRWHYGNGKSSANIGNIGMGKAGGGYSVDIPFYNVGVQFGGDGMYESSEIMDRIVYNNSLTDGKPENNYYLSIVQLEGQEQETTYRLHSVAEGGYPIRDFATDRVDVAERAQSWPSDIEKQMMWELVQLILVGEGVNLGMKGLHWLFEELLSKNQPIPAAIVGSIYEVGKRIENATVVKKSVEWVKIGWRVYKEFQETLDLINAVDEAYKKIGDLWDGTVTAYHNIREYYEKFDWGSVKLTNISSVLPTGYLYSFDYALDNFHKGVVDLNRALNDLALQMDTVYISPTISASKRIIWEVQHSNLVSTELELAMLQKELGQMKRTVQQGKGKARSAEVDHYLSILTGQMLLRSQEIKFQTMSDGMKVLANALGTIESEAQDWQEWGDYMSETFSKENMDAFGDAWREANNGEGMPTMMPVFRHFGGTPTVFANGNINRSRVLGDKDFWLSPDAYNFVKVDENIRQKRKVLDNRIAEGFHKLYP